jgi:hypothetical protein
MITVRIGTNERDMTSDIDEQWINQQINRRRADGERVCVRVTINEPALNVTLATPTCAGGGGGGRAPNAAEREVIELWASRGLNQADFTGGSVIAFLKQLRSLVGS